MEAPAGQNLLDRKGGCGRLEARMVGGPLTGRRTQRQFVYHWQTGAVTEGECREGIAFAADDGAEALAAGGEEAEEKTDRANGDLGRA